jgi:hypothetical protein
MAEKEKNSVNKQDKQRKITKKIEGKQKKMKEEDGELNNEGVSIYLYGALGHFISRGEYSGVNVKGVKGGDENIFLGTIGVSRGSTCSVDSFCFKK